MSGISLSDMGEFRLINWGAWVRSGGGSRVGWGNSALANHVGESASSVDASLALEVECYLLQLRSIGAGDEISFLMFELAKLDYVSRLSNAVAMGIMGVNSGKFYSLKARLIMLIAGTVLKNNVDTSNGVS